MSRGIGFSDSRHNFFSQSACNILKFLLIMNRCIYIYIYYFISDSILILYWKSVFIASLLVSCGMGLIKPTPTPSLPLSCKFLLITALIMKGLSRALNGHPIVQRGVRRFFILYLLILYLYRRYFM